MIEGPLVERLAVVVQRGEIEVADVAHAFAAWTHAAETIEGRLLRLGLALAPLHGDRAARLHGGHVERVRVRRTDVRRAETAEEDAQHRVGIGRSADGRSRVGTHPLLVDDDGGGQSVEPVDVWPSQCRHEALHERAVRLVDHPLRFGGNRAEHQRALARAGDAGEHGQPALRDLDVHVLEVVHARAVDADQIVAVRLRRAPGWLTRDRRPGLGGGLAHHVSMDAASTSARSPGSRTPQRTSLIRTWLPAGSRKAQSRTPYGCAVGSWITSAPVACTRSKVPSRSAVARITMA